MARTAATTGPVLLTWLKEPPDLSLELEGAPETWYEIDEGLRPWPANRRALAVGSGAAFAKRAPKIIAAEASGEIIARKSLVLPVLGGLPESELVLRPIALADKKGNVLDDDFVVLDVRAHAPLDRRTANVKWTRPDAPAAAWLEQLRDASWAPERTPRARIFRVGETLCEIAIDAELAKALAAATKKWLGARPLSEAEIAERAIFTNHPDATPPIELSEEVSDAAEDAYWRLERGANGTADRTAACKSPVFAYWLARTVDGAPKDDTLHGVLAHPVYSALYASQVARLPSMDLERAVSGHWWSALHYARLVAHAVPESFEATLIDSGYELDTLRAEIASLASLLD